MAINLMTKYRGQLTKALDYANILSGKVSTEYDWNGVKGIYLTAIKTEPLTDYNRNTTGNRYGTPKEVQDFQQYLELRKDRSVPLTIDKGNYQEGMMLKKAGEVIKAELNEVVSPELQRYALNEYAKNAGQYAVLSSDAPSIIIDLMRIEAMYANARIPKTERFVCLDANYLPNLRASLTNADNISDKLIMRGVVGKIGTLNIIETPHDDMPTDVVALAWWKRSIVNPVTIYETEVHDKPETLSGVLINMRFRYDAYVVGMYAMGVIALLSASGKQATAVTPTSARVLDLNSGDTVKYTLDGTDPRFSTTAKTVVSDTTISSTDAPVGTVIKAVTYNSSKLYPSDVKSATVAS